MPEQNQNTPTPEEEEKTRLRLEVEKGTEDTNILDLPEPKVYIDMICTDGNSVYWRPTFCNSCGKPKIVHPVGVAATVCKRTKITQLLKVKYEAACKSNPVMEAAALTLATRMREQKAAAVAAALPPSGNGTSNTRFDNRTDLSEWGKDESWESYKMVIEMYDKASEKRPAAKFNDLINALKRSPGRANLTDRLLQDLMGNADQADVIAQSIKWLGIRYGKTPTEEFIQAWRAYRTGLRKKDELIADYVNRFETITKKLEGHGVKLDKREKAVAMVEMAQLSTAECVAVLSVARFEDTGDDDGLEDRMKVAMRSIAGNIMGKETAPENTSTVLKVAEVKQPAPEGPDQVYWDGNRWTGAARRPNPPTYRTFQGSQPTPPAQGPTPQRQNAYQNQPGWRNNNYPPQQNRGGWRDNRNQRPARQDRFGRPYQVWYEDAQGAFFEEGEEGAPEVGEVPEEVMYSGQEQANHIILDTGSKYNVMGLETTEVLHQKMKEAGCEPPTIGTSNRLFRFGGNTAICRAHETLTFDLNLTGKPIPVEVHIIPGPLPFIIGKQWLKDNGGQLDLLNQRLKLNDSWIKTVDMGSGHEGLTWSKETHSSNTNCVYLGTKVPRKDWRDPEVMEAMDKEIKNLEVMGTYNVVKEDPRIRKIDSTWVITRKEVTDGKGTGAVKARLCVRGDQEQDDHNIKKDSPTVDRATVKTLFAISATQKWKIKTIDVTAAFLQGKKIERKVHVRPPAEYRREGEVWELQKGLYGLKEASMLWFKEVTAFFKDNGGQALTGDLAAFVFHQNGQLIGLVVIHVDDITLSGEDDWLQKITAELRSRFKISKEMMGDFVYTGINVTQDPGGVIRLDQNHYVDGLEDLPAGLEKDMTPEQKRALIKQVAGRLQYLNLSRPDLVFNVSMLSRAVKDEELDAQVEKCRKLATRAKNSKYVIQYGDLGNLKDLELCVFSDAAYGNQDLDRVRSTAGIIIFLKGPRGCAPILWRSRAIRRVCTSVKTAETLALGEALDAAINLSRQIHQMITGTKEEKGIPVRAYTDSRSLVDSVESCRQVVEGSMRQVVEKLKEHVQEGHVTEITWVQGARNWADGLTKKDVDMSDLVKILETGKMQ